MRSHIKRSAITLFIFFLLFMPSHASNDVALTVNGDIIYKDEYDYSLARYQDSLKRNFGDNIDSDVREKMKKDLIDDLIDRQLYVQEAKRRGITAKMFATEEEIEELLMSKKEPSQEGAAARNRAERIVLAYKARQIIPPKAIEALKDDILSDDIAVLDEYQKRAEKMRVKYLKVDPYAIANNMELKQEEVKSYYQKNTEHFRRPEVRTYAVLFFDPNDYVGMVTVTPQMISDYFSEHVNDFKTEKLARVKYVLFRTKDYLNEVIDMGVNPTRYYEDNLDKFAEPAEAKIRFISIKKPCDPDKLSSLREGLKGGVPFAELAEKYSDDSASAHNGGDLGYIKEGTLKEPFNGIAFGLEAGKVSDIIETDSGYCVFYIEEKKEGRVPSIDEVRDVIEGQLLDESASPFALTAAKRFKIEAKKIGFEKAASKKGLTVLETGYFGASERIPGIGRNLSFASAAFNVGTGEASDEIEYDEGYSVLEPVEIKQQEPLSTSEVFERIEQKIMSEGSAIYAESAARHALNLLSEGVSLKELPNRMSVHITTLDATSTIETPPGVGIVINKVDGFYVTVLATIEPSYVPDFDGISTEVAADDAMTNADKIAREKADGLLRSGAVTGEAAVETPLFGRNDYVIDGEYMRPFIEQCFTLNAGQSGAVKNLGKYYVVQVVERGILSEDKEESAMIRSRVLKEKRSEYIDKWLKNEKEKAQIQINI